MIQVDGLHKLYGDFPAVQGLSFSVAAGEVLGLVGPNGAGKTT
ncbi:MAG: ATP-binding cassette domain-containing protein, partial [Gemmatimonadales bacterium]